MIESMIEEFAPAKINLDLRVRGRRADGYHDLSSCVVFASVGDRVRLKRSDQFSLTVSGPESAGLASDDSNLALRAAHALAGAFPQQIGPAALHLEKNLPVASGIGGGSADAAAVLRALQRLYDVFLPQGPLNALALKLGADVPVCLGGLACHMAGIGEALTPRPRWPSWHALLVNPRVAVSTAAVFGRLGLAPGTSLVSGPPCVPEGADPCWINDLEAPARRLAPEIGTVLETVGGLEACEGVHMSGSGATCFGLFATGAAAAAAGESLGRAQPGWWIRTAILNGST